MLVWFTVALTEYTVERGRKGVQVVTKGNASTGTKKPLFIHLRKIVDYWKCAVLFNSRERVSQVNQCQLTSYSVQEKDERFTILLLCIHTSVGLTNTMEFIGTHSILR